MLENRPALESGSAGVAPPPTVQQRRRMLLAVVLLVFAVAVVLVKDRHILFGSSQPEATDLEPVEATETSASGGAAGTNRATPTAQLKKRAPREESKEQEPEAATPSVVATDRRALPPLEVEVVAGDVRQNVTPKNNAIQVDMLARNTPPANPAQAAAADSAPSNAAERVKMSSNTSQVLARQVNPSYPVLARQMKVQGSVVLQAWISKDGHIEDLKVLSGPAILSSAAREAVRQWRFKPYLQHGQPIETEAKITVNFTISTI
jgi:TonB family protein